jgi:hypothetical protein
MRARAWRTDRVHQRDRLLFAGVVIIGVTGTLMLLVLEAWTSALVAWAMTVVASYTAIVWWSRPFQVTEEQAGEAANDLGFILAIAMLAFSLGGYGGDREDLGTVFRAFAAAVASMGIGFFFKVLLQRFADSATAVEEAVRADMADAARHMHVELLRVLQDLAALRLRLADEFATPAQNLFTGLVERTEQTMERLLLTHASAVKALHDSKDKEEKKETDA